MTAQKAFACCDSTGNAYDVWYPTELGKDGFLHPVITWGDGSYATPDQYTYLLRHLATWGFIVIASETQAAHTGQEMIDAAQYVVAQNETAGSPFHHHVAVSQIGAMGHSQGSGGAVLALMNSGGFIKTAIPIEHPEQQECSAGDCPSMGGITSGSVFFVNGIGGYRHFTIHPGRRLHQERRAQRAIERVTNSGARGQHRGAALSRHAAAVPGCSAAATLAQGIFARDTRARRIAARDLPAEPALVLVLEHRGRGLGGGAGLLSRRSGRGSGYPLPHVRGKVGWGGFPRSGNPDRNAQMFPIDLNWIPAFAGMTAA